MISRLQQPDTPIRDIFLRYEIRCTREHVKKLSCALPSAAQMRLARVTVPAQFYSTQPAFVIASGFMYASNSASDR
jgi:hypothetical protein